MGIEHEKVLFYCRGDHPYLAQDMAKEAKEVLYYTPILGPHPVSRDDQIGAGLDGVEKIDDFEAYKDKVDLIVFPGVYDGEKCDSLRKEGHKVFGAGMSEEIELNRVLFLNTLEKVGLPVIPTYIADGIDDAIKYLTGKEDKWLKTPYCRGDFDTMHFHNMATHEPWFNWLRNKLGKRGSDTIEILIQDSFPCVCETGGDRYCIDGEYTKKGTIGYEVKDKGYIYRVVKEMPKAVNDIDMKMAPEFKRFGYRGAYSTELRINKKGEIRFTDLTARFGSPPGEGQFLTWKKFGQAMSDIADGKVPVLEENAEYGAIIILTSWFNEDNEICVEFPKEFEDNIKLKNDYKHEGKYYCVPNESDGFFGAVVTVGKSVKEVTEKAKEIASEVHCIGLEYDESVFDKAQEAIESGKQFGVIL